MHVLKDVKAHGLSFTLTCLICMVFQSFTFAHTFKFVAPSIFLMNSKTTYLSYYIYIYMYIYTHFEVFLYLDEYNVSEIEY